MSEIHARFKGTTGTFNLDIDFNLPATGVSALYGPSGCGKTTVLRCMAGLTQLATGNLTINGHVWQDEHTFIPVHERPLGYVFQEPSLFPHLSVDANLGFGQKRSKKNTGSLGFDKVVELLDLGDLLERSPLNLSRGERQRVAIGRALLCDPEILLMDEPLNALDQQSKNDILPFLQRLHDELAIPILYVSHELKEIEHLADHMILMEKGRVLTCGALTELLADPSWPLARMPDAASVLSGKVSAIDKEYGLSTVQLSGVELTVPGNVGVIGSHQRLRIIASDVALARDHAPQGSSILNGPVARIIDVRKNGPYSMTVFLKLGTGANGSEENGASLLSRITRKSWDSLALKKGDQVHALIKSVALAN
ncbi:MAG: molybdenum ABC transporter ATP-binding protein [bacterium]|nr:molybdenum ABC transporter ATP-binding protein [bacterium]